MPFALVTLNQIVDEKEIANVICFDNVQEDSLWLQGFADELRDLANTYWDGHTSTQWFLENISVAFVDGDHISYSVNVDFSQGNLQGNQVGQLVGKSNCLLITTSYVGAAPNRGRTYFGGFTESEWGGDKWNTDVLTDMRAMVVAWRDGISVLGSTASMQIARRPSAVFPTYVFNPVETVSSVGFNRSQRNRNY